MMRVRDCDGRAIMELSHELIRAKKEAEREYTRRLEAERGQKELEVKYHKLDAKYLEATTRLDALQCENCKKRSAESHARRSKRIKALTAKNG